MADVCRNRRFFGTQSFESYPRVISTLNIYETPNNQSNCHPCHQSDFGGSDSPVVLSRMVAAYMLRRWWMLARSFIICSSSIRSLSSAAGPPIFAIRMRSTAICCSSGSFHSC
eukprot:TRINITY_DN3553_c0_g1_i11.p2 TRINITY_DN3553_c0_g1~~TRINITY_DN3553_c0_g1_i11.p2  ORF type:complete len:113 (+),score=11.48 TRINITY_DN3553_c0_g1_i11:178-516(+)